MPTKALHFCAHHGCNELTTKQYCARHEQEHADDYKQRRYDTKRGSAQERGYDSRWAKYSKWFLKQPGNQICKLHLPGCKVIANCVDHIQAVTGKDDPKFWDTSNHQAACLHCNTVKGKKKIKGDFEL